MFAYLAGIAIAAAQKPRRGGRLTKARDVAGRGEQSADENEDRTQVRHRLVHFICGTQLSGLPLRCVSERLFCLSLQVTVSPLFECHMVCCRC